MNDSFGMLTWVTVLAGMALLPFLLTMVTAFAKVVIVCGLLRQALGLQQIPPTSLLTGLALVLTLHVMAPVVGEVRQRFADRPDGEVSFEAVLAAVEPPLRGFVSRHADPASVSLFRQLRSELAARPADAPEPPPPAGGFDRALDTLTVLAPAFVLTELTEAFQIGFLLFVPFLVVDLVVGNLLLALGMQMMSPLTISLPLKLLLFVMVDGWKLLLAGLVRGYAP